MSNYIEKIESGIYDNKFADIYMDESLVPYQKKRYIEAIDKFTELFGEKEISIYSAPGRSEVSGNHTDHQHGHVLAASINLDAIAVVCRTSDNTIKLVSGDDPLLSISLDSLEAREEEKGTTTALIRGVVAGLKNAGYDIGGFETYVTSDVLMGSGMSSSAAFECLIGTILSGLYNEMNVPAVEIAKIGQYAENVYFGKPCGLMDQMACSIGGLVHVDFENPANPEFEKIELDLNEYGYSLCITDTKGSHADLTDEYAAVPEEMKMVASFYGQDVLLGISESDIYKNINELREKAGDRAVLRALHFISENERVKEAVRALKNKDINKAFELIKASGNSSFKYLQNIYASKNINQQNVSLALAISELTLLDNGVCRVHGGGFAGTIQAFVKNEAVELYRERMDSVFGKGSCHILKIRKYGGMRVL